MVKKITVTVDTDVTKLKELSNTIKEIGDDVDKVQVRVRQQAKTTDSSVRDLRDRYRELKNEALNAINEQQQWFKGQEKSTSDAVDVTKAYQDEIAKTVKKLEGLEKQLVETDDREKIEDEIKLYKRLQSELKGLVTIRSRQMRTRVEAAGERAVGTATAKEGGIGEGGVTDMFKRWAKDIRVILRGENEKLNLMDKWRKAVTGALIDLHVLRIVGQSSAVVAASFDVLNKSLGYVIDVLLMPALPAIFALSDALFALADFVEMVNERFYGLPAYIALIGGGALILINTVASLVGSLKVLTAVALQAAGALRAHSIASGQKTLGEFGGKGGVGVGSILGLGPLLDIVIPAVIIALIAYGLVELLSPYVERYIGPYLDEWQEKIERESPGNRLTEFHPEWLASGGPLKLGQTAIVGEAGPEMLLPAPGGFNVIPNDGIRLLQEGTEEGGGILGNIKDSIGTVGSWLGGFSDAFSDLLGGMGEYVSGVFESAMGGGGVSEGVGTTIGDPVSAILSKGFSTLTMVNSSGFKTSNTLLAAIMTLLAPFAAAAAILGPLKELDINDLIKGTLDLTHFLADKLIDVADLFMGAVIDLAHFLTKNFINAAGWFIQGVLDLAHFLTDNVIDIVDYLSNRLLDFAYFLTDTAIDILDYVVGGVLDLAYFLTENAIDILDYITKGALDFAYFLSDAAIDILDYLTKGALDFAYFLSDTIIDITDFLTKGALDFAYFLTDTAIDVMDWIAGNVLDFAYFLTDTGINILDYIAGGVIDFAYFLTDTAINVLDWIAGGILDFAYFLTDTGINAIDWIAGNVLDFAYFLTSTPINAAEWFLPKVLDLVHFITGNFIDAAAWFTGGVLDLVHFLTRTFINAAEWFIGGVLDLTHFIIKGAINFADWFASGVISLLHFINPDLADMATRFKDKVIAFAHFLNDDFYNAAKNFTSAVIGFAHFLNDSFYDAASRFVAGVIGFAHFLNDTFYDAASRFTGAVIGFAHFLNDSFYDAASRFTAGVIGFAHFLNNTFYDAASRFTGAVIGFAHFLNDSVYDAASRFTADVIGFAHFLNDSVYDAASRFTAAVIGFAHFLNDSFYDAASRFTSGVIGFAHFLNDSFYDAASRFTGAVISFAHFLNADVFDAASKFTGAVISFAHFLNADVYDAATKFTGAVISFAHFLNADVYDAATKFTAKVIGFAHFINDDFYDAASKFTAQVISIAHFLNNDMANTAHLFQAKIISLAHFVNDDPFNAASKFATKVIDFASFITDKLVSLKDWIKDTIVDLTINLLVGQKLKLFDTNPGDGTGLISTAKKTLVGFGNDALVWYKENLQLFGASADSIVDTSGVDLANSTMATSFSNNMTSVFPGIANAFSSSFTTALPGGSPGMTQPSYPPGGAFNQATMGVQYIEMYPGSGGTVRQEVIANTDVPGEYWTLYNGQYTRVYYTGSKWTATPIGGAPSPIPIGGTGTGTGGSGGGETGGGETGSGGTNPDLTLEGTGTTVLSNVQVRRSDDSVVFTDVFTDGSAYWYVTPQGAPIRVYPLSIPGIYDVDAPGYAAGGITGPGFSLVGEEGPELALFPTGTAIIPTAITKNIVGAIAPLIGGGGIRTTPTITPPDFSFIDRLKDIGGTVATDTNKCDQCQRITIQNLEYNAPPVANADQLFNDFIRRLEREGKRVMR